MTKEEYWFWLSSIDDIFHDSIKSLIEGFEEPENIYKATEKELEEVGRISTKKARAVIGSRNNTRVMYRLEKLKKDGVRFIYSGGPDYPEAFYMLDDKPHVLFVKGELPDPDIPSAGIVGARKCSGYGKEMAIKFSQVLSLGGVQIISGMAKGVDSYASRGAIESGGKTFVVLGSGIDVVYPAENLELFYRIILSGGGVITEFPPGSKPVGWHFLHRNRLISALSDKLLVIEAKKQSGTLITARFALDQGKDVYALPGRITDPLSEGCNMMLSEGAGVLTDPVSLLDEFYGTIKEPGLFKESGKQFLQDSEYGRVFNALGYEPLTADEIALKCGIPIIETASLLSELELNGLCLQPSKDQYCRL